MNNLATKNTEDFTITPTGEAFTTQRVAAKLCGVSVSTINEFYRTRNIDVNQGITPDLLNLPITHYAIKSKAANDTARASLAVMAEAGCKAWMYHEAGYEMQANKPKQLTELGMISIMAAQMDKQNQRLDNIENVAAVKNGLIDLHSEKIIKAENRMDSYETRKPVLPLLGEITAKLFSRTSELSEEIVKLAATTYGIQSRTVDSFSPEGIPIKSTFYKNTDLYDASQAWANDSIKTSRKQWEHKSGKTFRPSIRN